MKNEKQTYIAPELVELGDVQELTQGTVTALVTDAAGVSS
ncbi:MAG: lasso RiPP family leader peptide-containing protein [Mycobacteriaceae bacterium]|nr:lasso RiPP family leader peptide-containing protein [Mycobacteriaceae bacterium]